MVLIARGQIACLGLLCWFVGCGPGGPALYPAGGSITFEGKPVDGASVVFQSDDGSIALATTDGEGKFNLSTGGKAGAPAGNYKVMVSKAAAASMSAMPTDPSELMKMKKDNTSTQPTSLVPLKYSMAQTSDLSATVATDKSKNNFPLKLEP